MRKPLCKQGKEMNHIDFGNVANFYSTEDIFISDASYFGENKRQRETRYAMSRISSYFDGLQDHSHKSRGAGEPSAEGDSPLDAVEFNGR
jgi:hypothetical protein